VACQTPIEKSSKAGRCLQPDLLVAELEPAGVSQNAPQGGAGHFDNSSRCIMFDIANDGISHLTSLGSIFRTAAQCFDD